MKPDQKIASPPPLPDAPQRTAKNEHHFSDIMPPESKAEIGAAAGGLQGKALPKAVKHIENKKIAQQEMQAQKGKGPKIHALGGTPPDLKLRRLKGVGTPRSAQPLEEMTPQTAPEWRTRQAYTDNPNWKTKSKGGKK